MREREAHAFTEKHPNPALIISSGPSHPALNLIFHAEVKDDHVPFTRLMTILRVEHDAVSR